MDRMNLMTDDKTEILMGDTGDLCVSVNSEIDFVMVDEAEWGEKVTIGMINGKDFTMRRPMNDAAMRELSVAAATALALYDRLVEAEKRLAALEKATTRSPWHMAP